MATLQGQVPQNSQDMEGLAIIHAPLAKIFSACADADVMIASGAEAGWRQSVEALGRQLEGQER